MTFTLYCFNSLIAGVAGILSFAMEFFSVKHPGDRDKSDADNSYYDTENRNFFE